MKSVTVIIPNYNGERFLKPCMDALWAQTCRDFETLVIDNASKDQSVQILKSEYPWARVCIMEKNLGFAGGVNAGIRMSETPFVLLLNNDTEVAPDFVEKMLAAVRKRKRIFSVSSRMIQFHNRQLMDDAGDLYTCMGWAAQKGVGQGLKGYDKPGYIFSACAGAAIYRRKVFEKIGYFDEKHFAYLEDLDIGFRARVYGYTNVYEPGAVVYHVGSGTSGSRYNSFKVRLAARNSLYVIYKNMALWQIIINSPMLLAGYLIKIGFFCAKGFGKDYLNGLIEGAKTCSECERAAGHASFLTGLALEAQMLLCTFIYTAEFLRRKLKQL